MHVANALARRRRYATRLIAGDHQEPRLLGLACRSIAASGVFGGARDCFAARLLACGFEMALLLSGASRLLARLFSRSLPGGLEAALLFGLAGGSLLGCFLESPLAGFFTRGFETMLFFCSARGSLTARFFPRGLARRFDAAFVFGGAGVGFAARLFSGGLAGGLANGIKATRLFSIARQRIASCVITRYGVATGLIAPTFTLTRIAAFPVVARTILTPLAPRPAVAIAPLRFGLEFVLAGTFVAAFAAILTIRAAFVFDVVSGRVTIAHIARGWLRLGPGCTHRTPVRSVVTALFDHPVEPLVDRHVDSPRGVALLLARLRAETSLIPRTARFHPRAQTTSEGAVCAPLSDQRWLRNKRTARPSFPASRLFRIRVNKRLKIGGRTPNSRFLRGICPMPS